VIADGDGSDMETYSVDTAGAEIVYDIADAQNGEDRHPPLVMIGQPIDASGFRALALYLPDRIVATYDPRAARSNLNRQTTAGLTLGIRSRTRRGRPRPGCQACAATASSRPRHKRSCSP
jgi:hypothetical protein